MKKITEDWLRSARMDLDNISKILHEEHLTPVAAFHSQSRFYREEISKSFNGRTSNRI